jgi:hypothetical protein
MESSSAVNAASDLPDLRPRVGERVTDNGIVTFRDVTKYGLHRMRVEKPDGYPSLDAWTAMLRGRTVLAHNYSERLGKGFTGILWLYWKE